MYGTNKGQETELSRGENQVDSGGEMVEAPISISFSAQCIQLQQF